MNATVRLIWSALRCRASSIVWKAPRWSPIGLPASVTSASWRASITPSRRKATSASISSIHLNGTVFCHVQEDAAHESQADEARGGIRPGLNDGPERGRPAAPEAAVLAVGGRGGRLRCDPRFLGGSVVRWPGRLDHGGTARTHL